MRAAASGLAGGGLQDDCPAACAAPASPVLPAGAVHRCFCRCSCSQAGACSDGWAPSSEMPAGPQAQAQAQHILIDPLKVGHPYATDNRGAAHHARPPGGPQRTGCTAHLSKMQRQWRCPAAAMAAGSSRQRAQQLRCEQRVGTCAASAAAARQGRNAQGIQPRVMQQWTPSLPPSLPPSRYRSPRLSLTAGLNTSAHAHLQLASVPAQRPPAALPMLLCGAGSVPAGALPCKHCSSVLVTREGRMGSAV